VKQVAGKDGAVVALATGDPTHPESRGAAVARLSNAEREAIREELHRLLASTLFHSSHRCQGLLRYVVEEALNGNADSLKERTVGVSVFRRDPVYDTNSDPVVRMAAGELRKKLAQYYYDPANRTKIRIELPIGSYAPVFRIAEVSPNANPMTAPWTEKKPFDAPHGETPHSGHTGRPIEAISESNPTRPLRTWASWAAGALLAVAVVLALVNSNLFRSPQYRVWSPILDSSEPVTICLGDFDALGNAEGATLPQLIARIIAEQKLPQRLTTDPGAPQVPFVDVAVAAQITGYLSKYSRPFTVRRESTVTLDDLRGGPTVLVGAFDNGWALVLLSNLRFRFRIDPAIKVVWIEDIQNPGQRNWKGDGNQKYADSSVDYAIVTRVLDPNTGKWILSVAGLGMHGTEAAGRLLTDPALANAWPPGVSSSRKNFQIVLKTTVMDGHTGLPQIIAVYSW
jgi:hypothetical protein